MSFAYSKDSEGSSVVELSSAFPLLSSADCVVLLVPEGASDVLGSVDPVVPDVAPPESSPEPALLTSSPQASSRRLEKVTAARRMFEEGITSTDPL